MRFETVCTSFISTTSLASADGGLLRFPISCVDGTLPVERHLVDFFIPISSAANSLPLSAEVSERRSETQESLDRVSLQYKYYCLCSGIYLTIQAVLRNTLSSALIPLITCEVAMQILKYAPLKSLRLTYTRDREHY